MLELYVEMHNKFLTTKNNAYLDAMCRIHGMLDKDSQRILPDKVPFYTEITVKEAENLVKYGVSQQGLYNQLILKARDITSNFESLIMEKEREIKDRVMSHYLEEIDVYSNQASSAAVSRIKSLSWWRRLWKLF